MMFLADMGISMATAEIRRQVGEDVRHLREELLHRMPDEQILAKAAQEHRVVLTFDLDFGELLAASGGTLPSVILFGMRNKRRPR